MKSCGLWLLLLWCALILETARADLIPSQSLTLPVAVACMIWFRTGTGVILGAGLLLCRWLLHSSAVPLDVLIPVTAVPWLISRQSRQPGASLQGNRHLETVFAAAVIALTIVAVSVTAEGWQPGREWVTAAGAAVTVFILLATAIRIAEALGVRRQPRVRSTRLW